MLTDFATQRLVSNQMIQAGGKPSGIVGTDTNATLANNKRSIPTLRKWLTQQVNHPADGSGNHWPRVCHSFDQRKWRAFVARCQRDNIQRGIKVLRIATAANENHIVMQSASLRLPLELAAKMSVTDNYEPDAPGQLSTCKLFLEERGSLQKKLVVFDFSEPADDTHEDVICVCLQLIAKGIAALLPLSINLCVESEWNYRKLTGTTNRKLLVDFPALLFANNNNAIGAESRQDLFYA